MPKALLRDSASVLDAALDSGLSVPAGCMIYFVTHEAMSPGEWKTGGVGLTLTYGFHPSPFGTAIGSPATAASPALPSPIPAVNRPRCRTCSGAGRAPPISRTTPARLRWRSESSTPNCGARISAARGLIGTDFEVAGYGRRC